MLVEQHLNLRYDDFKTSDALLIQLRQQLVGNSGAIYLHDSALVYLFIHWNLPIALLLLCYCYCVTATSMVGNYSGTNMVIYVCLS